MVENWGREIRLMGEMKRFGMSAWVERGGRMIVDEWGVRKRVGRDSLSHVLVVMRTVLVVVFCLALFCCVEGKKGRRWQDEEDDLLDLFSGDGGGGLGESFGGGNVGPNGETSVEEFMERAMAADEKGDYAGAAQAFKDAREFDPQDPSSANNYGVALMRLGRENILQNKRGKGRSNFVDAAQSFRDALALGVENEVAGENLRAVLHALRSNFRYQVDEKDKELLKEIGYAFEDFQPEVEEYRGDEKSGGPRRGGPGGRNEGSSQWFDEELAGLEDFDLGMDLDGGEDQTGGGSGGSGGSGDSGSTGGDLSDLGLDDLLLSEEDDAGDEMEVGGGGLSDQELDDLLAELDVGEEDGGSGLGSDGEESGGSGIGSMSGNGLSPSDATLVGVLEQALQDFKEESTQPRAVRQLCKDEYIRLSLPPDDVDRREASTELIRAASSLLEVCGVVVVEGVIGQALALQLRGEEERFAEQFLKSRTSLRMDYTASPLSPTSPLSSPTLLRNPFVFPIAQHMLGLSTTLDLVSVESSKPGAELDAEQWESLADEPLFPHHPRFEHAQQTPAHALEAFFAASDIAPLSSPLLVIPGSHIGCHKPQLRPLPSSSASTPLCPPALPARPLTLSLPTGAVAILDSRTKRAWAENKDSTRSPHVHLTYTTPWFTRKALTSADILKFPEEIQPLIYRIVEA